MKSFSLIVAVNNDSLIGVKEYGVYNMPWPYLKDDMNHFKKCTTSIDESTDSSINAIIIGYNTWTTLPKTYKNNNNRYNIVISHNDEIDGPLLKYVKSFRSSTGICV